MRQPHAIQRAAERYSLDLTVSDLDDIAACIQQNHGKLIGYMQGGRTAWKLKWRNCWIKFVLDKTLYDVITFLPYSGPLKIKFAPGPYRNRPHV